MFSVYLQSPVRHEYLLTTVYDALCTCSRQKIEKKNKTFMSFYRVFISKNVSFVFFFIKIDLVFVFRSFYIISPNRFLYFYNTITIHGRAGRLNELDTAAFLRELMPNFLGCDRRLKWGHTHYRCVTATVGLVSRSCAGRR